MRTLILNSGDIVDGTNNSILEYIFPGGGITLSKGQKLALANLQMYYSTFNITSTNKNNSFSYIWVDGITYNVSIPDGFYDVPSLNNYLHFAMVQNKHYLITTAGDYVYLMTLGINPSRYSCELNCFGISNALATANGWTLPSAPGWVLPTNFIVPELTVPANNNFGLVIGFSPGNYPSTTFGGVIPNQTQTPAYTTDQQFLSSTIPQVTPLSSYILTCSLINNNYAVPNNLLYSFSPEGVIGEQFTVAPNQLVFINVNPGQYTSFRVSFIDQNFRPVEIQDPNMIIQLIISEPDDNLGL